MHPLRIALYQPDIPQNTGTILRTAACLNLGVDIIEPCGFILGSSRMRRAGMDYLDFVDLIRHRSWNQFRLHHSHKRLILLTTKGTVKYIDFEYKRGDILIFGSETNGVPQNIHLTVEHRLNIPLTKNARSLNIAQASAMVTGEALRQLSDFPN